MFSLTFGKNEKGSYILCNRSEVGCEIGKFASRMYNSCQNCEKKGCFICKAYFFVLSQLEESESDLQINILMIAYGEFPQKLTNLSLSWKKFNYKRTFEFV